MRLFKEDINWNKLFVVLYVIVAIILVIIIWKPKKTAEIAHYQKLDKSDVDKIESEKYVNSFINYINDDNGTGLYSKLSDGYRIYNKFDERSFLALYNSDFNTNNIFVSNVKRTQYNNNTVYRITLNVDGSNKKVNIIKSFSNNWSFTLDDFYDFKTTKLQTDHGGIKFIVDSVYQAFDYIELTCYIENMTDNIVDLHLERDDSVLLRMSNKESIKLSNSQIDRKMSIVNKKSLSSRTLIFNVDLETQAQISQVVFKNIEINGQDSVVEINFNI